MRAGAGRPVRFRMGEPEPVLRRLQAHQELLRQFRAFLTRPRRRATPRRRCSAPFPDARAARDHGQAAGRRRSPTAAGRDRAFMKQRLRALKPGRLQARRTGRMIAPDGKPLDLRDHAEGQRERAGRRRLPAARWRSSASRSRSARSTRAQFLQRQIDYDFDAMLFNYTASLSPGIEQVGRWGSAASDKPRHVQLCRRRRSGGRRHDRRADQCAHARRIRRRRARLRSAAFEWRLRRSALFQAEQWIAHWKRIEQPETTPLIRLSAADLVARGK